MSGDERLLWKACRDRELSPQARESARQAMLLLYLPLVRLVVGRLAFSFPSAILEAADMIQAGTIGLMQAFERFDPDFGVKFRTYASRRIKGQVLDELRALDWVPRSVRDKGVRIHGLHSLEELLQQKEEGFSSALIDSAPHHEPEQENSLLRQQAAERLGRLMQRELSPKQRQVLSLYYAEELTFKAIGAKLGLTESRICQIHSAAIAKLRAPELALAA